MAANLKFRLDVHRTDKVVCRILTGELALPVDGTEYVDYEVDYDPDAEPDVDDEDEDEGEDDEDEGGDMTGIVGGGGGEDEES